MKLIKNKESAYKTIVLSTYQFVFLAYKNSASLSSDIPYKKI